MPALARRHPALLGLLVCASVLAAFAAACTGDPTSPAETTLAPLPKTSPALSALEVTAEPAASEVRGDGSVAVRVRVVNRADTTVRVAGSGSCTVRLEVRDSSGAIAEPSRSLVCTADCRGYAFAPGQPYVVESRFAARVWSNDAQREVRLARGSYQLYGRVDGDLGTCGGTPVEAASAPARVQVR